MQETPADKLLPLLVEKLKDGTDLRRSSRPPPWPTPAPSAARITTATTPSWPWCRPLQMAQELPEEQQALPVLKVLYRNTNRIQD